jgi:REP element-mobilizing transposase RayT
MALRGPLAFLITWTTYGTWLPGDARGWVTRREPGIRQPDAGRERFARSTLSAETVQLNETQRGIVETTVRRHCELRNWALHALSVQTTHVHVVVSADIAPERAMEQFKAWCTRRLNEAEGVNVASAGQHKWWTRHGSTKWIKDEAYLHNAIRYVLEGQ